MLSRPLRLCRCRRGPSRFVYEYEEGANDEKDEQKHDALLAGPLLVFGSCLKFFDCALDVCCHLFDIVVDTI